MDPSGGFVYSVTGDAVYRTDPAGSLRPAGRVAPGGKAVALMRVN